MIKYDIINKSVVWKQKIMAQTTLTPKDFEQITSIGITEEQVLKQLQMLKKDKIPVKLVKPATVNDGIIRFSETEKEELVKIFFKAIETYKIIKFVPASGAASRMFKVLYQHYLMSDEIKESEIREKTKSGKSGYIHLLTFINGLKKKKFAFYDDLKDIMLKDGINIKRLIHKGHYKQIIEYILSSKGLNYNNLPKALIKFHNYENYSRTPLEEHLFEAIEYSKGNKNEVRIHFTISPEFKKMISDYLNSIIQRYNKKKIKFKIKLSEQKSKTNTIAVDNNNKLFRDKNNMLVIRPGGHGALIENLNEIEEDIIFIKNVDNIAHDKFKKETITYKKILGGYLVKIQARIFKYLKILSTVKINSRELNNIFKFSKDILNIYFPENFKHLPVEKKQTLLYEKLNRPIRICGMVKIEGESGGGPFWIKENDNSISLQIVENIQINDKSKEQKKITLKSTHSNPVDVVCSTKDHLGNKFDLLKYIDHSKYLISHKSLNGKPLKTIELPGLWNGAMAKWITIFVEVPITTFNPVKTVNDLLRDKHQKYDKYLRSER